MPTAGNRLALLHSFRAQLLLVLGALLVATLGVQYYLNRREARLLLPPRLCL